VWRGAVEGVLVGRWRVSRDTRACGQKGNAQADSDDARAAQENASVRVSGSLPLCRAAFAQVAGDRQRRS